MFDIDKIFISGIKFDIKTSKNKIIDENGKEHVETVVENVTSEYEVGSKHYFQNELINGYITILSDKTSKNINLRSIDNDTELLKDVLGDIVKKETKEVQAFDFYTLSNQCDVKNDYTIGKTGIGPFALNNNNHILCLLYGIEFNNSTFISQIGYGSLHRMNDDDGNNIGSWLSALINAHVDIAKDPYITKLLVTKYSYNLVNLLIRTGMGDKTFYFLCSPIMRKLVEVYDRTNSLYLKDGNKSQRMLFTEEQQKLIKDMFGEQYYASITKNMSKNQLKKFAKALFSKEGKEVMRDIIKKGYDVIDEQHTYELAGNTYSVKSIQCIIMLINERLQINANQLSDLVKYTKIDTKKQGKNISEILAYERGYNDTFDIKISPFRPNNIEDVDDCALLRLRDNTYIGKKTDAFIDLFFNIMKDQTFEGNDRYRSIMFELLSKLGTDNYTPDLFQKIQQSINTAIKSDFFNDYCEKQNVDIRGLVSGNNTIYDRLNKIKMDLLSHPEDMSTIDKNGEIRNVLLKLLIPGMTAEINPLQSTSQSDDTYKNLKFVRLFDGIDSNSAKTNYIIQAWEDLLTDTNHPELQKFARDLAIYAFYTSGDFTGFNKLFKFVPNKFKEESGFNQYINNQLNILQNNPELFDIDLDDIILNNWRDNRFIPTINPENDGYSCYYDSFTTRNGGTFKRSYPVVMIKKDGEINPPSFIKVKRTDCANKNSQRSYIILKLQYSIIDEDGNVRGVYGKVNPKGNTISNNIFTEYGRNDNENNERSVDINKMFEFISSTINGIQAESRSDLRTKAQERFIAFDNSTQDSFYNTFRELIQQFVDEEADKRKFKEGTFPVPKTEHFTINVWYSSGENADLSNMANRPFEVKYKSDGKSFTFNTVEGAFHAAKFLYTSYYKKGSGHEQEGAEIFKKLQTASGFEAKKLGRQIKGLDVDSWDKNSPQIMKQYIKASFEANKESKNRLLSTGNAIITHTQERGKWGTEFPRILMEVREELSKKESTNPTELLLDESGNPVVVYRGYAMKEDRFANTIEETVAGTASDYIAPGYYFTNDLWEAEGYAKTHTDKSEEPTKEKKINRHYVGDYAKISSFNLKLGKGILEFEDIHDFNRRSKGMDISGYIIKLKQGTLTKGNSEYFVTDANQVMFIPNGGIDINNSEGTNNDPTNFNGATESKGIIESDKTILTNQELIKLRPYTGTDNPRIAVASEHTDPVFFAKRIIEILDGKQSVEDKFRNTSYSGKDFAALYIITKHDGLPLKSLLEYKIPKMIHFSITTLGNTKYEPGVMKYTDLLDRIKEFIQQGLDPEMVTIRIDPIIPGVTKIKDVENVIKIASEMGIKNIRFSVMDQYKTTKHFMENLGYDYSKYYDSGKLHARDEVLKGIAQKMLEFKDKYGVNLSTCAEPMSIGGISKEACLSVPAVNKMLGTSIPDTATGKQRALCSCYGGKTDLLRYDNKCASSCVYCYAHHNANANALYYNEDGTLKDTPLTRTKEKQVEKTQPTTQTTTKDTEKAKPKKVSKPSTFKFKDGTSVDIPFTLNEQQKEALYKLEEFLEDPKQTSFTLAGYAGTGKTTIMKIFEKRANKNMLNGVVYASPTHAANAVTRKNNPNISSIYTIQQLLGITGNIDITSEGFDITNVKFDKNVDQKIVPESIIIMDESSMINEDLYKLLIDTIKQNNAKIVFLGDPKQLQPVGSTNISPVFTKNKNNTVELTKVERTGDNGILNEATNLREGKPLSYKTQINEQGEGIEFTNSRRTALYSFAEPLVKSEEYMQNSNYFKILVGTNNSVDQYNAVIRQILFGDRASKEFLIEGETLTSYNNWGYYKTPLGQKEFNVINSGTYKVLSIKDRKLNSEDTKIVGFEIKLLDVQLRDENTGRIFTVKMLDPTSEINSDIAGKLYDIEKKAFLAPTKEERNTTLRELYKIKDYFTSMNQIIGPDGRIKMIQTFKYGYAMTVHKSQGSTYDNVLVDGDTFNKGFDDTTRQQLKYVAITRAKNKVEYVSNDVKETTIDNSIQELDKLGKDKMKQCKW